MTWLTIKKTLTVLGCFLLFMSPAAQSRAQALDAITPEMSMESSTRAQLYSAPYPGQISLGERPRGLAWNSGTFWVLLDSTQVQIAQINSQGQELARIDAPAGILPGGLDFDGTNFWLMDTGGLKAYLLDGSGGVIRSIPVPGNISAGLAWDGTTLWAASWSQKTLYQLNPENGDLLQTFRSVDIGTSASYGLAHDGQYLWASNAEGLFQINPANGNIEEAYQSSFDQGGAMGLTFDGQNLWGCGGTRNEIVDLDVASGSPIQAAPRVTTGEVNSGYTSATIYGYVVPNGLQTQAFFQMGRSSNLDFSTETLDIGSGYDLESVWANIYDLAPGTVYYYRICASNSQGTAYGETRSFRTDDDYDDDYDDYYVGGGCFLTPPRTR